MAITVNSTPAKYMPVYNPIDFSVESTNYAQSNFNFIADIYINSAVTMTARLKFPPVPTHNYGHIDIGGILKNYLTSNPYLLNDTADFSKNESSILRYDVKWGEEYGPSSGITVYTNLNTSNGYAFNGSLEFVNVGNTTTIDENGASVNLIKDWSNFVPTDYIYSSGTTTTFLTNSPRRINIKSTEGYALYFLNDATNVNYQSQILFYGSAGHLIGSPTFINNAYTTVGLYDTRYERVACGPANLTASGVTIPVNAAYYRFSILDNSSNATSEVFRFYLDDTCSKAAHTYRFIFKNRFGAFDAFTFNGQYQRNEEIKKDFYKSVMGSFSSSVYTYSSSNRGEKQFNTVGTDSFKCTSGWITQQESDWLSELIESPEVYVSHPLTSVNVPITITDTAYSYKTIARDQLFNLELTFRTTFSKVRQQY